jgi:hypothetical protein
VAKPQECSSVVARFAAKLFCWGWSKSAIILAGLIQSICEFQIFSRGRLARSSYFGPGTHKLARGSPLEYEFLLMKVAPDSSTAISQRGGTSRKFTE